MRTVPPIAEPLTLAETKLYLRVDHADDDTALGRMIQTAREAAEAYLGRSLMTQDWQLDLAEGLEDAVWLPRGPVQSILSVQRIAETGTVLETLPTDVYHLNPPRTFLLPHLSIAEAVRIVYRTGYAAAEAIPAAIRQGLLIHISALYEGVGGGFPDACAALYASFRERRL
jgi:uncharacterized phiE125 gp8 family phage protein